MSREPEKREPGRHGPPGEAKDWPTPMLLNEVSKLFHDDMRRSSDRLGIKDGYRHVLIHLVRQGSMTQLQLAQHTHCKPPTISVTLQKMEGEGIVRRESDPADARQTLVSVTEKGRQLENQLHTAICQEEQRFLSSLTQEEQEILHRLLLKIRQAMLEDRS